MSQCHSLKPQPAPEILFLFGHAFALRHTPDFLPDSERTAVLYRLNPEEDGTAAFRRISQSLACTFISAVISSSPETCLKIHSFPQNHISYLSSFFFSIIIPCFIKQQIFFSLFVCKNFISAL